MAIIKEMVGLEVISGFKGVIDYYYYMGLAIARAWPKSPGKKRSAPVMAQWPAFGYAAANWNSLSPEVQQAWRDTAQGGSMSGRDLFTKAFITDYFREGQWD